MIPRREKRPELIHSHFAGSGDADLLCERCELALAHAGESTVEITHFGKSSPARAVQEERRNAAEIGELIEPGAVEEILREERFTTIRMLRTVAWIAPSHVPGFTEKMRGPLRQLIEEPVRLPHESLLLE